MDEFEMEMKTGFLEEATQLLSEAEQCFLELESHSGDAAILEKIFRLAHNLKGSAKAVGFAGLGEFTHELETFLLKLKQGGSQVSRQSVDLLLRCNDHVAGMVEALKANPEAQADSASLLAELRSQIEGNASLQPATADGGGPQAAPTELESAPGASDHVPHSPATTPAPQARSSSSSSDDSIRVSLARLDKLLNFVGEMVILQGVLREQAAATGAVSLRKTAHQLAKVTKEVQDLSMSLRMVPLKPTFQKMQRIVRDTSAALGKQVNITLQGEDTEVDKTILESLGDPLVHLVRNGVDHAIEMPEARRAAGKHETGEIALRAFQRSGSLVVEIQDDGVGLDPGKLRANAVKKGILSPNTELSDKECYQLIFASGFSTKSEVTDISGRGVGMDVVKTNIQRLQGDIQIETVLGQGTCFRVVLPLTLAIIDAMVIRCGAERYVLPLSHVHESIRPARQDVHPITGVGEAFVLRGESLPLYRLERLLGRRAEGGQTATENQIAIVFRNGERPYAVLVDDIVGQQQVVIKKLGDEHRGLKGFNGSAILGDGKPSLIIEMSELVHGPASNSRKAAA